MVVFVSSLALVVSLLGSAFAYLEVGKLKIQVKDLNEQVGKLKYSSRKRYYNKPKPQGKQVIKG